MVAQFISFYQDAENGKKLQNIFRSHEVGHRAVCCGGGMNARKPLGSNQTLILLLKKMSTSGYSNINAGCLK